MWKRIKNDGTRNVEKSINTTKSIEKLDDVLDETTSSTNLCTLIETRNEEERCEGARDDIRVKIHEEMTTNKRKTKETPLIIMACGSCQEADDFIRGKGVKHDSYKSEA